MKKITLKLSDEQLDEIMESIPELVTITVHLPPEIVDTLMSNEPWWLSHSSRLAINTLLLGVKMKCREQLQKKS